MKLLAVAISVVALIFSSCVMQRASPPLPQQPEEVDLSARSIDSGFLLSPEEEKDLQLRAAHGDRDAAFRLSFHFMSAGDRAEVKHWQLVAAQNGHPVAQYSLWVDLKDKKDCASMRKALEWLEAAAGGGVKEAQRELEGYKSSVRSCSP